MLFCNLIKSRKPTDVKIKLHDKIYDGTVVKDKTYYGGRKIVIPMIKEGDEEIYAGPTTLSYRLYKENIIG